MGCRGTISVHLDSDENEPVGTVEFTENGGVISAGLTGITGRHAVYLRANAGYEGWAADYFKGRTLFELEEFVFVR